MVFLSSYALVVFQSWLARLETARKDDEKAKMQELQRALVPRTQFDMDCRFYGPEGGKIIVDLQLIAENKGQTIRGFTSIKFDIYGMRTGEQPTLYPSRDGANRLRFQDQRISEETKYVFSIEPGIRQVFPLITLIDADIKYVIVKIELKAAQWGQAGSPWYGEQRFFPVNCETAPTATKNA